MVYINQEAPTAPKAVTRVAWAMANTGGHLGSDWISPLPTQEAVLKGIETHLPEYA